MLLRIILFLLYVTSVVFLAETERVSWTIGLPAIIVGAIVAIYHKRLKGVKLAGAEIELFEKQAEAISKTQIEAIIKEAEKQKAELAKVRTHLAQRHFKQETLLKLLDGHPKGRVRIMAVEEDSDSVILSCTLRDGLRAAGWAVEDSAVPAREIYSGKCQAGPIGITLSTASVSEAEKVAFRKSQKGEEWVKTPYTVLYRALKELNINPIFSVYRDGAGNEQSLQLVVAQKYFLG